MSKWSALAALGEIAKGGGNYYGQIATEKLRMQRLAEQRNYDENQRVQLQAEADARAEKQRVIDKEDAESARIAKQEDARSNIDYQIEQQVGANERKADLEAKRGESASGFREFYDEETGESVNFQETKDGRLFTEDTEGNRTYLRGEDLKGLSEKRKVQEGSGKTTEGQRKTTGYLYRMNDASQELKYLLDNSDLDASKITTQLLNSNKMMVSNVARNPQERAYVAYMRDWVRSKLRKESGAVIGDQEAADEIKAYFPEVGDDAETIRIKQRRRAIAEMSLYKEIHGENATEQDFLSSYGDPFGAFGERTRPSFSEPQQPVSQSEPTGGRSGYAERQPAEPTVYQVTDDDNSLIGKYGF